jgi:hypothetical protein
MRLGAAFAFATGRLMLPADLAYPGQLLRGSPVMLSPRTGGPNQDEVDFGTETEGVE